MKERIAGMMKTAETVSMLLDKGEAILRTAEFPGDSVTIFSSSAHTLNHAAVLTGKANDGSGILLVVAAGKKFLPDRFQGETERLSGGAIALRGKMDHTNAEALCRHFPWCTPLPPPEKGICVAADLPQNTPALFSAASEQRFFPLAPTWDDAVFTAFALDFRHPFGALEPRETLAGEIEGDTALSENWRKRLSDEYADKHFILNDTLTLSFSSDAAEKCAGRWKRALESVRGALSATLAPVCGKDPISPLEHLFLARELRKRGVEFSFLAPVFPAERKDFFRDFPLHAAISATYGGCRLHLPAFFWDSPAELMRALPHGFAVSWDPAQCADLSVFFAKIQKLNLGNSTK